MIAVNSHHLSLLFDEKEIRLVEGFEFLIYFEQRFYDFYLTEDCVGILIIAEISALNVEKLSRNSYEIKFWRSQ